MRIARKNEEEEEEVTARKPQLLAPAAQTHFQSVGKNEAKLGVSYATRMQPFPLLKAKVEINVFFALKRSHFVREFRIL